VAGVGAVGRRAQRTARTGVHVIPLQEAWGTEREGTAHPQQVRDNATGSGRAALCQCPECLGLVAAGCEEALLQPLGNLAVPDATAGKCVRHLRKNLLYFHKIIITAARHGPYLIKVVSAPGLVGEVGETGVRLDLWPCSLHCNLCANLNSAPSQDGTFHHRLRLEGKASHSCFHLGCPGGNP
jgi:hypothetical protein